MTMGAVHENDRDITDEFIEVKMILPFKMKTENKEYNRMINMLWSDDLEKLWVEIHVFDSDLKPRGVQYLTNCAQVGKLYHTQEIVPELKGGEK